MAIPDFYLPFFTVTISHQHNKSSAIKGNLTLSFGIQSYTGHKSVRN